MTAIADRWYSQPDAIEILNTPDDDYGARLTAENDAAFAHIRSLPPIAGRCADTGEPDEEQHAELVRYDAEMAGEPMHSRPCLSCLCLFETTHSCADLCPDCTSRYTHAMLQDERNGEDDAQIDHANLEAWHEGQTDIPY